MSFGIYIIGFLILIGGLIYAAVILHNAAHWIGVRAIARLGLAVLKWSKPRDKKIRRNRRYRLGQTEAWRDYFCETARRRLAGYWCFGWT
jgi:hypothetical protein